MSGIDPKQLRDLVVRPVLEALNLPGGEVAEKLMLGTAAQESGFRYLRQNGNGPAVSLWQIEPSTAMDAMERAPNKIQYALLGFGGSLPGKSETTTFELLLEQLPGNLYLGAAMCRVVYYLKPFKMPAVWNLEEMASKYKLFYNSPQGAATAAEFIANYQRLVAPIYD